MNDYQEFIKEVSNKLCEIKEYDERVERIEKEEDVHPMSKIGFLAKKNGTFSRTTRNLQKICGKLIFGIEFVDNILSNIAHRTTYKNIQV